jgi:hypothetical protein
MLEDFGATSIMLATGQTNGHHAWLIRFQWRGNNYRFAFTPLECKEPLRESSFGGKRRRHEEQARYQMGRIAVYFVKAILTAAEAHPHALFGFMELPGVASRGGIPYTAGELDISKLVSAAPLLPSTIFNGDDL